MFEKKSSVAFMIIFVFIFFNGCASAPPKPEEIIPPKPISDNSGEYMCPYTQDGMVAPWCDKGINASIGSTVGKTAGAYLGSKALEQVPFIGGFLGSKAGDAVGRKVAIEASGGWEYIKETSDLSFNSLEDMAVWLYVTKSNNEHYQETFKAAGQIYPELNKIFYSAIKDAPRH